MEKEGDGGRERGKEVQRGQVRRLREEGDDGDGGERTGRREGNVDLRHTSITNKQPL